MTICGETAETESEHYSGTGYTIICQRDAGHGGKWHRDGEVRWRVQPREPAVPAPQQAVVAIRAMGSGGQGLGELRQVLIAGTAHHMELVIQVNGSPVVITAEIG